MRHATRTALLAALFAASAPAAPSWPEVVLELPHSAPVTHSAQSLDGSLLATAAPAESMVKVWRLPEERLVAQIPLAGQRTSVDAEHVTLMAFSPDSTKLAIAATSEEVTRRVAGAPPDIAWYLVEVVDLVAKEHRRLRYDTKWRQTPEPIRAIGWTADAAQVLTVNREGALMRWDPRAGKQTSEARLPALRNNMVGCAALSPTGAWVAYNGAGGIQVVGVEDLLDKAKAEPPRVISGANAECNTREGRPGLAFADDDSQLLTALFQGPVKTLSRVQAFATATGEKNFEGTVDEARQRGLDLAPFLPWGGLNQRPFFDQPRRQARAVAFARDGALVVLGSLEGVAALDLAAGRHQFVAAPSAVTPGEMPIVRVAASEDGERLALVRRTFKPGGGQSHGQSRLTLFPRGLDADPVELTFDFEARALLFSPDGRLVTLDHRGTVRRHDPQDGRVLEEQTPEEIRWPREVLDARWVGKHLVLSVSLGYMNASAESLVVDGSSLRLLGRIPAPLTASDAENQRWYFSTTTGETFWKTLEEFENTNPRSSWFKSHLVTIEAVGHEFAVASGKNPRLAIVSENTIGVVPLGGPKKKKKIVHGRPHASGAPSQVRWVAGGKAVASASAFRMGGSAPDGTITYWYPDEDRYVRIVPRDGGRSFAVFADSGHYWASTTAMDDVRFRVTTRTYPFDQFDLALNRPDVVLAGLGFASRETVALYRRAWEKRLRRMQLDPARFETVDLTSVPSLELDRVAVSATSAEEIVRVPVTARAPEGLSRLFVDVNGVPIYGVSGKTLEGAELREAVAVPLATGRNAIRVSVLSKGGVESLSERLTVEHAPAARRPRTMHVVSVGVSKFRDERFNLGLASKDARDIAQAFAEAARAQGMEVKSHTLEDQAVTRAALLGLRGELERTKVDDAVVLFVATHGLLDEALDYYLAMHETDFAAPKNGGLRYDELEALLDGIPARDKLVMIDACHSGEVDREETTAEVATPEGGTVRARGFVRIRRRPLIDLGSSFDLMRELFVDLRRGNGAMVIAAAAGKEWALESEQWNNGVFTASVLEGLSQGRADLNADRIVRVQELRDYVSGRVRALTRGAQNPTTRLVNRENDFVLLRR